MQTELRADQPHFAAELGQRKWLGQVPYVKAAVERQYGLGSVLSHLYRVWGLVYANVVFDVHVLVFEQVPSLAAAQIYDGHVLLAVFGDEDCFDAIVNITNTKHDIFFSYLLGIRYYVVHVFVGGHHFGFVPCALPRLGVVMVRLVVFGLHCYPRHFVCCVLSVLKKKSM